VPLPAEFYERQYITYAQVWVQAVEMAAWLREQGIRAGTRVAIGGLNSSQ
jgi:long-subunit acyl-CoA synthetase (AMP-forming)